MNRERGKYVRMRVGRFGSNRDQLFGGYCIKSNRSLGDKGYKSEGGVDIAYCIARLARGGRGGGRELHDLVGGEQQSRNAIAVRKMGAKSHHREGRSTIGEKQRKGS